VRILEFIETYLAEHDYPPTIREIGKAVGISSTSVVKYNLERLQDKGKIKRSGEVSRGLRLMGNPRFAPSARIIPGDILAIRKLGLISAGTPIAAVGEQDNPFAGETLSLTRDLVPDTANIYALQVKGDSMIDALVHDGDWVIIKYQNTAERGDMVVAWITDREETTLKYYHPEGAQVRLQPANPAYEPIYIPAERLEIQGKVVAVVRQLA
jgi:repressor LexA